MGQAGKLRFSLILGLAVASISGAVSAPKADTSCHTLEPMYLDTMSPAEVQIGSIFPVYSEDCHTVNADAVQELVATHWALEYWNKHPQTKLKIGQYVGPTCTSDSQSARLTARFLEQSGYFSAKQCRQEALFTSAKEIARPLGVISPPDAAGSAGLAGLLQSFPIPTVSYTDVATEILEPTVARKAPTLTVVPKLDSYFQALLALLNSMGINFLSIVTHPSDQAKFKFLEKLLNDHQIYVDTVIDPADPDMVIKLAASDSHAVVILVSKKEAVTLFTKQGLGDLPHIIFLIPTNGETFDLITESARLAMPISQAVLVLIQQESVDVNEFADYFLDILQKHHKSIPILGVYMEQVYQCAISNATAAPDQKLCDSLSRYDMLMTYVESPRIAQAMLAAYTLAALSTKIADTYHCWPSANCTVDEDIWTSIYLEIQDRAPPVLQHVAIQFGLNGELQNVKIEGYQLFRQESIGTRIMKVLDLPTGNADKILLAPEAIVWVNGQQIKSRCSNTNQKCRSVCTASTSKGMSVRRAADLYFMTLLDATTTSDRLLSALAAQFAVSTAQSRYKDLHFLENVHLETIMTDQSVVLSDILNAECFVLQGQRDNVTISSLSLVSAISTVTLAKDWLLQEAFLFGATPMQLISPWPSPEQYMAAPNGRIVGVPPIFQAQAKALVRLLVYFRWSYITVVISKGDAESQVALEEFKKIAPGAGICISDVMSVHRAKQTIEGSRPSDANSRASSPITVVFASAKDTAFLLRSHIARLSTSEQSKIYIFVGDAHNWQVGESVKDQQANRALGALSIQPKLWPKTTVDFQQVLSGLNPITFSHEWFLTAWEDYFYCNLPDRKARYTLMCSGRENWGNVDEAFGRLNVADRMIGSTENLLFALDAVYKKLCPEQTGLCEQFFDNYREELTTILSTQPSSEQAFTVYNFRANVNSGKLEYAEIGSIKESDGPSMTDAYTWYRTPSSGDIVATTDPAPESSCTPPLCTCSPDQPTFSVRMQKTYENEHSQLVQQSVLGQDPSNNVMTSKWIGNWKSRTWSYIFLALNSAFLLCAVCALLLIVVKIFQRVITGNQSLGICLLCGLISLYITAYFFIFDACDIVCRLRYFFHSFSYTLCFGVMIAKATQLRNSETLGSNGFISYWTYWLLLFFICGVQLALNLQWIMVRRATVTVIVQMDEAESITKMCSWSTHEFLVSQTYVIILLLLALFLAILSRNVKRNYMEARWLAYAAAGCILVWLSWMLAYAFIADQFKDTIVIMELIICATVMLGLMFGPKLYILLSYEAVLVECPYPSGVPPPPPGILAFPTAKSVKGRYPLDRTYSDLGVSFFDDDFDIYERGQGPRAVPQKGALERCDSPAGSSSGASTKSTAVSTSNSSVHDGKVYAAVVRKKSRNRPRDSPPNPVKVAIPVPQPVPPFVIEAVHRTNPVFGERQA